MDGLYIYIVIKSIHTHTLSLSGPTPDSKTNKHRDRHISETNHYRHNHQFLITPPNRTQYCGIQILHYQNAFTSTHNRKKTKKWTSVQQIAQNNNFHLNLIQKLNSQLQRKQTNHDQNNNDKTSPPQKKDNIHILQSSNMESHQYIQTHKRGNILQEYQHHTTTN